MCLCVESLRLYALVKYLLQGTGGGGIPASCTASRVELRVVADDCLALVLEEGLSVGLLAVSDLSHA